MSRIASLIEELKSHGREKIVEELKVAECQCRALQQALRVYDALHAYDVLTGEPVVTIPAFTVAIPPYEPIPLKEAEPGDILDPAETAVNTHHAEPPVVADFDTVEDPRAKVERYLQRHGPSSAGEIAMGTGLKPKAVQNVLADGPFQQLATKNWKLLTTVS